MSSVRRSGIIAVTAWVVSVFIFSLAYWNAWLSRPDSFVLNKEFNLTPYQQLLSRLWSESSSAMWAASATSSPAIAIELDELSASVDKIDREATALQRQLHELETQQRKLELAAKAIYDEHSTKLWSNVEKYKMEAVKFEIAAAERAKLAAEALAQASQQTPSPVVSIAAANANVELARAQYALAVRQAEVGEYVLGHLREFADPEATAQFDATEAKLAAIRHKQLELMGALGKVRGQAFSLLEDWHAKRTARLEWIDFVYFSAGVSTTTTFGDIVPNSRFIRVIVLVQLVFSILLVGYLISLLGSPRSPP